VFWVVARVLLCVIGVIYGNLGVLGGFQHVTMQFPRCYEQLLECCNCVMGVLGSCLGVTMHCRGNIKCSRLFRCYYAVVQML